MPSCCYPENTKLSFGGRTSSSLAAFRRPRLPIWAFEDWPGLSDIRGVQFCRANLGVESPSKLRTNCPEHHLLSEFLSARNTSFRFCHCSTHGRWAHGLPSSFLEAPERRSQGPGFAESGLAWWSKKHRKIGLLCCIQCIF